jgi:hypothetical protein
LLIEELVEDDVHRLGAASLGERRRVGDVAKQRGDVVARALQALRNLKIFSARCGGVSA